MFKLYSDAHILAAKAIFPERVIDRSWFNCQWTNEEINLCKEYEYIDFIRTPCLKNWPAQDLFNRVSGREEIIYTEKYIKGNKNILSVGCGFGEKEIYLAKKYPDVDFKCIDNSPYTEQINVVVKEMGLKNIIFIRKDLNCQLDMTFDLVFSWAVIYCIANENIKEYFSILNSYKKKGGSIIVGCTSNLSSFLKIKLMAKKYYLTSIIFFQSESLICNHKQTGWIRASSYILKKIPLTIKVNNKSDIYHYNNDAPKIFSFFSSKIWPFSNSGFIFLLK